MSSSLAWPASPRRRPHRRRLAVAAGLLVVLAASGCTTVTQASAPTGSTTFTGAGPSPPEATPAGIPSSATAPYSHTGAGALSPAAAHARPLVYVPNQLAGSVQVIDPRTYTVIDTFPVGRSPEHVVSAIDVKIAVAFSAAPGRVMRSMGAPVLGSTGDPNR